MAEEYKVIKGFDTAEGEARYDYEFLLNKPDIIGQIRAELEEYVPPVDNSLTNEGAAADAKATGEAIQNAIQEAKNYTDQKEIEVDKTLKLEGKAAEAAATGDAIKAAKNEAIEEAEQRTQELLGEYVPDLEDVVYSGNDDDDIPTIEQETIYATHLGVNPAEDFALKGYVNALGANLQDKFNNYYTIEQIGKSYLTAGQVKQDYLTIEGAKDIYTTPEAVNLIVDKRIEKLSEGEIVLEGLATTEQLNEVKNSKAPAGYGLGGFSKFLGTSDDIDNIKENGWYSWQAAPVNAPAPWSNMLVMSQDAHYFQLVYIFGTDSVKYRYGIDTTWYQWNDMTPRNFAPAGYGYGGYISTFINSTTEAEFETALDNFINSIRDDTPYQIRAQFSGITVSLCTIIRGNADYATIYSRTFTDDKGGWRKVKVAGDWQPLEWENPPMNLGVEYRTTERCEGSPVYAIRVNAGALPNRTQNSVPVTKTDGTNVTFTEIVDISGVAKSSGGNNPIGNQGGLSDVWITNESRMTVNALTSDDLSSKTLIVTIRYTKD